VVKKNEGPSSAVTSENFFPIPVRTKISELTAYDRNARIHPEEQIRGLMKSISDYGWLIPVVVDKDGIIVSGHGRIMAAERLGRTEVPVVRAEHLTPDQIKGFRIADNRLPELGDTDLEMIKLDIDDLKIGGMSDFSGLGFSEVDLSELGAELPDDGRHYEPGPAPAPAPTPYPSARPSGPTAPPTEYRPNLAPPTASPEVKPSDIAAGAQRLETAFQKPPETATVVVCPHCGEEFQFTGK